MATLADVLARVEDTALGKGHARMVELERLVEREEAARGIVAPDLHPPDSGSQIDLFEHRYDLLLDRVRRLERLS
jgi:hypothetical protein